MKKIGLLLISFLVIVSCEKIAFQKQNENQAEALFEELWTVFNNDYAGFEERDVDWNEQYNIYRPQVSENTTDQELYEVLKQMLRSLDDGHVKLMTDVEKEIYSSNIVYDEMIDDALFDLELVKSNYLNNDYKESGEGGNTHGLIDNVGYLHLAWISDNLAEMDIILDEFLATDGMIIDLRHNAGGDFTWAFSNFGRLTNIDRMVFRSKTKNGVNTNDYTSWYDWSIHPSGSYFDKKIVLLTDRFTISAGERTTMALKTLPNVIHIGDTTNGAFSTLIGKELQNGWYYSVATQKIEFHDGLSYEGIGMIPDLLVKNTLSEMQSGIDKTLETAMDEF